MFMVFVKLWQLITYCKVVHVGMIFRAGPFVSLDSGKRGDSWGSLGVSHDSLKRQRDGGYISPSPHSLALQTALAEGFLLLFFIIFDNHIFEEGYSNHFITADKNMLAVGFDATDLGSDDIVFPSRGAVPKVVQVGVFQHIVMRIDGDEFAQADVGAVQIEHDFVPNISLHGFHRETPLATLHRIDYS